MTDIEQYDCIEHARGQKCGKTWFQTTIDGHTVGGCTSLRADGDPVSLTKKDLPLTVDVQHTKEQTTVTLATAKGAPVSVVAFTPKPGPRI